MTQVTKRNAQERGTSPLIPEVCTSFTVLTCKNVSMLQPKCLSECQSTVCLKPLLLYLSNVRIRQVSNNFPKPSIYQICTLHAVIGYVQRGESNFHLPFLLLIQLPPSFYVYINDWNTMNVFEQRQQTFLSHIPMWPFWTSKNI